MKCLVGNIVDHTIWYGGVIAYLQYSLLTILYCCESDMNILELEVH